MKKRNLLSRILTGVFILSVVVVLVWTSDRVTLQGERTIYTVDCTGGTWNGERCTGRLAAGARHAFRASARRNEVVYWIKGSDAPSGKYTDCTVQNRDNWTCNVRVGQPSAATYELRDGRPTKGSLGLTMDFHDVPKWKWWAINGGLGFAFSSAG